MEEKGKSMKKLKSSRRKGSYYLRDVDPDLLDMFKAVCFRRGRTIKGMLVALIKETTLPTPVPRGRHEIIDVPRLSHTHRFPR